MRTRTLTYWDGSTETSYICERCETIVLDPPSGCQHCHETTEKKNARLAALLPSRQQEEGP